MCSQENLRNWILISSQDQNQQISCPFRHIENMNRSVQLLEHDWRLASLLFFFLVLMLFIVICSHFHGIKVHLSYQDLKTTKVDLGCEKTCSIYKAEKNTAVW